MGGGPIQLEEVIQFALPWPEPSETLDRIRKTHPHVKIRYFHVLTSNTGQDQDVCQLNFPLELFKDATILVTLRTFPPSPSDAPKLKLVHVVSAGADAVVKSRVFQETNIPFTNSSGIHGPQITEWFVMTALAHSHHYNVLYEQQKKQEWAPQRGRIVRDLVGQKLGVLGYGSIGRQSANVARAMGMEVIAYTATPKDTPEKKADHGFVVPGTGDKDGHIPSEWYSGLDKKSLHNFLAQDIDILLVSVPLTEQTRHFLSTEEFDILSSRKKTFISNIARGPIIDQAALVKALNEGKLRGAALDVTDPEPLPADDPLWKASNVTITPHISGASVAYADRSIQVLELNLDNLLKGKPLINTIDRKKGY
ncbi:NAD(P)-binding domain [Venturia nashicola]|uniref:NAD(P)-binding domain n=1 Tax=Venturia nashicola TaxID=86259 RepID=A0A4Z1P8U0_9PEZI|nr:NAD(P)-binding domain [Venturia nashicola]TLD25968.1 NAD(P)-binding domain [Venturia nashicola]